MLESPPGVHRQPWEERKEHTSRLSMKMYFNSSDQSHLLPGPGTFPREATEAAVEARLTLLPPGHPLLRARARSQADTGQCIPAPRASP